MKNSEPAAAPLDTIFTYETPEGVALRLELAGPAARGLAWGCDFVLRMGLCLLLFLPLHLWGGAGRGAYLICLFAIEWLYPVFFEATKGATPGKRLLGLEVVRENGAPLDWTAAMLRNILRAADLLPACYALGLAAMLVHPRLQRLGDMAAGTLVVYKDPSPDQERIPEQRPLAPSQPLSLAEQQLVLDFCSREADLPGERAAELAALVPALTGGGEPREQLLRLGNWFLRGGKPAPVRSAPLNRAGNPDAPVPL